MHMLDSILPHAIPVVTISFRIDNVMVHENEGPAVLVAELIGAQLDVSVQLQFSTSSDTAEGQFTRVVCLCINVPNECV